MASQSSINGMLATLVNQFEQDVRQVILDAARQVAPTVEADVAKDSAVLVKLAEEDAQALVNGFTGSITIGGNPVSVQQLLQIAKAFALMPGIAGPVAAVEADVQALEGTATADASNVEGIVVDEVKKAENAVSNFIEKL